MPDPVFDAAHAQYLAEQRRGVLATISPAGSPQAKPVGFRYDPEGGTIDIAGHEMERSAKFRNVGVNPQVAFTVDDVPDPDAGPTGVRFLEIRGLAEQARLDSPISDGLGFWVIRIHPRRLVSYNIAGSGFHTADLGDQGPPDGDPRPVIDLTGDAAERACRAVERLRHSAFDPPAHARRQRPHALPL